MGVDAGIFALKAKKFYWFDRLNNIESYWDIEELGIPYDFEKCDQIRTNLCEGHMDHKRPATMEEVAYLADACSAVWAKDKGYEYKAGWCENIKRFVSSYPDDTFVVRSDHDYGWPDYLFGYEEDKECETE
jgi:hypothetical protein